MERRAPRPVNNDVYHGLGDRWYDAHDDPVALLRAQARLHVPWIADRLARAFGRRRCRVLDVGCGAGFVANGLARQGHEPYGVDMAQSALDVAARHDRTGRARYVLGDALALPFADGMFDAACAMDVLEHVEDKAALIAEVARVLGPGGLFFFHTFNRTWQSELVVIRGVEWFVRNTPVDLHVLRLFMKPSELRAACGDSDMRVLELRGCAPARSPAFARMLLTGTVGDDFAFRFRRGDSTGYSGVAEKLSTSETPRSRASA
jgi:2-polyprenyl-6-hydroxyphenyl methylase/3-demethylubiquinone-9 3-methyltransferase